MEYLHTVYKILNNILKRYSKLEHFVETIERDVRRGIVRLKLRYCRLILTIRLSCLEDYAVVLHDDRGTEYLKWDNAPHHRNVKTFPHHLHDQDGSVKPSSIRFEASTLREDLIQILIKVLDKVKEKTMELTKEIEELQRTMEVEQDDDYVCMWLWRALIARNLNGVQR